MLYCCKKSWAGAYNYVVLQCLNAQCCCGVAARRYPPKLGEAEVNVTRTILGPDACELTDVHHRSRTRIAEIS